jgi:hypothetical protein
MESFEINCFLTQGICVKFALTRSPSTIFPRIFIFSPLLFYRFCQSGTSLAFKEMMVDLKEIENFPYCLSVLILFNSHSFYYFIYKISKIHKVLPPMRLSF